MVQIISPAEAKRLLDEENAEFIDVREAEAFACEHIAGAHLKPLQVLPLLPPAPDKERPAIFYYRTGRRTGGSLDLLERLGHTATYIIDGGLAGWKQAGLPTLQHAAPLPMPRQIQMAAGALVFAFSLLSFFMSGFTWLTLFIGAGLMFAGYTGICIMDKLLARMPWNMVKPRGCKI